MHDLLFKINNVYVQKSCNNILLVQLTTYYCPTYYCLPVLTIGLQQVEKEPKMTFNIYLFNIYAVKKHLRLSSVTLPHTFMKSPSQLTTSHSPVD